MFWVVTFAAGYIVNSSIVVDIIASPTERWAESNRGCFVADWTTEWSVMQQTESVSLFLLQSSGIPGTDRTMHIYRVSALNLTLIHEESFQLILDSIVVDLKLS